MKKVVFFIVLCSSFLVFSGNCKAVTINASDDFVDGNTGELKSFFCEIDGVSYSYNPDGNIKGYMTSSASNQPVSFQINWGKMTIDYYNINQSKIVCPDIV